MAKNIKVLIIEDDAFLVQAYRVKFAKAGIEAVIAQTGKEALEMLPTLFCDVILLDLVLPELDGFEVLKQIRAMPTHKSTPIIICSNLGQKEDIDKGMQMGANDYFVKSNSSLDVIIEKIKALIP